MGINVIHTKSYNNENKVLDIINFITLFLTCIEGDNDDTNNDSSSNMIITRDVLIAIIFHYCDSIHSTSSSANNVNQYSHLLPSSSSLSSLDNSATSINDKSKTIPIEHSITTIHD